jgi:hypothetical protein
MLADLSGATSSGRVKRESAEYGSLLGEPPIEVPGLPAGDISRQQLGIDNPAGMTGEMSPLSIGGMLKLAGKGLLSGGKAALGALGDGGGLLAHTLFHGTPHKFDRFALDKIGTGEGAQAYGHGLYFAENPGVAKNYAPRDFDAEEVMMQRYKAAESVEDYESMEVWERAMMHDTADEIREIYRDTDYGAAMRDKAEAIASEVEQLAQQGTKGHLYEIEYPDELLDNMLDWDAPLSEQPESVQSAIDELFDLTGYRPRPDDTGEELYDFYAGQFGFDAVGNRAFTSEKFAEAGIPGIRYFDQQSRVTGIPRKKVISNFLDELPDDAEFDEVMELVGTGHFSKAQDDVLRALDADDWLGFDYPSQAINEAFGPNLVSNFDPSPKLVKAISNTVEPDATRNIVVFNPDDITSVKRDNELVWENRSGIRPD